MPREAFVQREVLRLWGAHPSVRLWRANSGRALVATATGGLRSMQVNIPGCPDAIGFTSVAVERLVELCIPRVAIFTGLEFKGDRGVIREDQQAFADVLIRFGGIHAFARSVEDVDRVLGAAGVRRAA